MGVYSNNTQRYINVTKLYQKLGKTLSKALLGFHALTGSDYSASFSRRGKVSPFKKLEKNESCQTALGNLGNSEYISEEVTAQIEKFVCQMYGYPKFSSIDEVRLEICVAKYRSKKGKKAYLPKICIPIFSLLAKVYYKKKSSEQTSSPLSGNHHQNQACHH